MITIFDIDDTLIPTLYYTSTLKDYNVNIKSPALYQVMDDNSYSKYRANINDLRENTINVYKKIIKTWLQILDVQTKSESDAIYLTSRFKPNSKIMNFLKRYLKINDFINPCDIINLLNQDIIIAYDDNPARVGLYLSMGNVFINLISYHWNESLHDIKSSIRFIEPVWKNIFLDN